MIIINKYTNKSTLTVLFMVHYLQHGRIISSTEKLDEKTFKSFKRQLLKGHKHILIFNVVSVAALKLQTIEDINTI